MKVLVAGDYSPKDRLAEKILKGETQRILSSVMDIIHSADYSIVNFESAVVKGKAKPIDKLGPNLKCTPEAVKVLKDAGFDCVTLANNHFRDYGDEGVKATVETLKEIGLDYVGGGLDIDEAETVLYKEIEGKVLALINICENEFSIAGITRAGSASLDTVKVYHRIAEARQKVDYVLLIVHGGHEHYQLPSPRMKELYRFFIEVGADAVVNHHQHCYSGYEFYNGKPIVYGLGNFCFDWKGKRGGMWNEGYLAILDFTASGIQLEVKPYVQCDENPSARPMNDEEKQRFDARIKELNAIIADDKMLAKSMDELCLSRRSSVMNIFGPYTNRYVRAAAARHLIPYILPKSKALEMIDYISCESQRDVTLGYLDLFVNE